MTDENDRRPGNRPHGDPAEQIAARIRDLNRTFRDGHPAGTEDWVFVPREGQTYAAGTTVPLLARPFAKGRSGLFVPKDAGRGPSPIDLIQAYMTLEEATGRSIPLLQVIKWLHDFDLERLLIWCAGVMARQDQPGASRADVDQLLAKAYLQEPYRSSVVAQLTAGRALIAPQGLLVLTKLALRLSRGTEVPDERVFLVLLLAIQSAMGNQEPQEDTVFTATAAHPMFGAIVSNATFSRRTDLGSAMATLQLRWREHPQALKECPQWVDLEGLFSEATGLTLDEFIALGVSMWTVAVAQPGMPFQESLFATLGLEPATTERALEMVAGTPDELAQEISQQDEQFGAAWSFDALRHRPIVRLAGDRFLAVAPSLVFDRFFGWLPIYDLVTGLQQSGKTKTAAKADSFFRTVCEAEALESLGFTVGPRGGRFYTEPDLQAAYGRAQASADAAIDYEDAWVVVEISTRKLTRPAVIGGSPDALERDFHLGIIEKARQIQSTIDLLVANESALTGSPARPRRRYVPVLVVTEGFPVNPMTTMFIAARLKEASLLQDTRVGQLHILDQEELHLVEAVVEHGGPGLLGVLEEHESGNLRGLGLRDFLALERRPQLIGDRATRLAAPFQAAWKPALEALRRTTGDSDLADIDDSANAEGE